MNEAAPSRSTQDSPSSQQAGVPAKKCVLVVTGMTGAGKTTALKALQDLGYESIDHLPLALFGRLVLPDDTDALVGNGLLAVGVDVRTRDFDVDALLSEINRLGASAAVDVKVVFFYCDDDVLCRRYKESRHRHPFAVDRPLLDGIAIERQMMAPLRARADMAIDTSGLSPGALKRMLERSFGRIPEMGLVILVSSFSFSSGVPRDADLVFDVRFLNNPHYRADLRPLTGKDAKIARFIQADPAFEPFFASLTTLLEPLLPRYAAEGKTYLTIGMGCTGGRHRSVFVAGRLAEWLKDHGQRVILEHRDLERSEESTRERKTRTA